MPIHLFLLGVFLERKELKGFFFFFVCGYSDYLVYLAKQFYTFLWHALLALFMLNLWPIRLWVLLLKFYDSMD